MSGAYGTLADRFWKKVEKLPGDGCWTWRGAVGYYGYGVIRRDYKIALAHRIAYELTYGDPGSLDVLHRCDHPLCVRPDHLFLGTQADNMQDMDTKGRRGYPAHKLTPDERAELVERYHQGGVTQEQLATEYGITVRSVGWLTRNYR